MTGNAFVLCESIAFTSCCFASLVRVAYLQITQSYRRDEEAAKAAEEEAMSRQSPQDFLIMFVCTLVGVSAAQYGK